LKTLKIEDGEPFKFDARVAVKPDIKLGKLEGYGDIHSSNFEVTEEDVDER
jgi:trigger factor